jgi:hypothetical protein
MQVLSVLAELFCFTYIGSSISMNTSAWRHGVTWTTLASAGTDVCNVSVWSGRTPAFLY